MCFGKEEVEEQESWKRRSCSSLGFSPEVTPIFPSGQHFFLYNDPSYPFGGRVSFFLTLEDQFLVG